MIGWATDGAWDKAWVHTGDKSWPGYWRMAMGWYLSQFANSL